MIQKQPIVFGDPLVLITTAGEVCTFTGDSAASDPFEVLPGEWQVAIRNRFGTVGIHKVGHWRVASVPNHVLEMLIDGPGECGG